MVILYLLHYSDYVLNPSKELKQLNGLLGDEFKNEMENGKVLINLEPGHVFAGNRSRLESGKVVVAEDTKWKQQLSRQNKFLSSVISFPLYKYIVTKYHKH